MTWSPMPIDDFRGLLRRLAQGPLSPDELKRFNDCLTADAEAQELFVDHAMLDVCLEMLKTTESERAADAQLTGEWTNATDSEHSTPPNPLRVPPSGFLGSAAHGAVDFFSQVGPLSYLIATLIMFLGMAVAWNWKLADNAQLAYDSPSQQRAAAGLSDVFVGRITGAIDCRWVDPNTAAVSGGAVPLRRKYALLDGLVEITYDSGARVILQGPCTYEVESSTGGFLHRGKLVARVEKKVESRASSVEGTNQQSPNPQSQIPNLSLSTLDSQLFAVRTPTATVTDLGTEFGVEVSENGATATHVFQGTVEVQPTVGDNKSAVRLSADESVRVSPSSDSELSQVEHGTADSTAFVRPGYIARLTEDRRLAAFHRWQVYSQKIRRDPALVAYYDFQRREDSPAILHGDGPSTDSTLHGRIEGATWTTGRMLGKHALYFDGNQARVKVDIPMRMTQMTLAAWIAIEYISDNDRVGSAGLLMPDNWDHGDVYRDNCHWQITRSGEVCLSTVSIGRRITGPLLPWQEWRRDRWRHLVTVADPAQCRVTFYLDSKPVFSDALPEVFAATFGSSQIGNWDPITGHANRPFCGRMDELLILGRVMTDEEVKEMFAAGAKP